MITVCRGLALAVGSLQKNVCGARFCWMAVAGGGSVSSLNIQGTTVSSYHFCKKRSRGGPDESGSFAGHKFLFAAGILGFFGLADDEEELTGEARIIHMIKLSKLSKQKGEVAKSEQLLHLALRAAQDLRHEKAQTYIIDELANNAYEAGNYQKAEKLFKDTAQKLILSGVPTDDNAIIHISGKLACMYALVNEDEKAGQGFTFCLRVLEKRASEGAEDQETLALLTLITSWYGEFLFSRSRFSEAVALFRRAHQVSLKVNGAHHHHTLLQLNNQAAACSMAGRLEEAAACLMQAITDSQESGDELDHDLPSYYVNLANVYLQELKNAGREDRLAVLERAEQACDKAVHFSRVLANSEAASEAEKCLAIIQKYRTSLPAATLPP